MLQIHTAKGINKAYKNLQEMKWIWLKIKIEENLIISRKLKIENWKVKKILFWNIFGLLVIKARSKLSGKTGEGAGGNFQIWLGQIL